MLLGALLLGCVSLAGCMVPTQGGLVVGRDATGELVAVIGYCAADRRVSLLADNGRPDREGLLEYIVLAHGGSSPVMRVTLTAGEVPDGWTGRVGLPDGGIVSFHGYIGAADGGDDLHRLPTVAHDIDDVPPLPADAEKLAVEDC